MLDEFPVQGRGGKGLKLYKDISTSGLVAGAIMISDEDNILIVGKPNSICISAKDVPLLSRDSLGNSMVKGSLVKGVVKI
jgi:DNA gyrase subunit A